MKIVCICSTKNEGDIIEAFVRLNGKICDSFFFVDESSDNTREIISLLVREGYDLNFLPKPPGGHNQPNSTKALISTVARSASPDWIFLLDADEIIVAADKRALIEELTTIAANTYLAAPWKTYVPTSLAYFESTSPLSDCFAPRKEKGEPFKKASIPGRIADYIVPTAGNHTVQSAVGGIITEQAATSYYLAHFAVRSAEQIMVKNLLATHNLMTRADALKGEGFHVFPVTDLIRARDYKLTLEDLQSIAINYARTDEIDPASVASELDLQNEPELRTRLTYLELGRIKVLARLDAEIERLSKELRGLTRGFTLQSVNFRAVNRP
jgi:hypothetical protein